MTEKYLSKSPERAHFVGKSVCESENERASLPHPKSIRVGQALVPFVKKMGAWAAPYNRNNYSVDQWVYRRSAAIALAEKINAILVKG